MAIRKTINITGQNKVVREMNKRIAQVKARTRGGMQEAALVVRREAQLLTPVNTGNLKGSAYTEITSDLRRGVGAVIGYTAAYAPYVHENLDAHHAVGQARFLATALVKKAKEVYRIILRSARIK